MDKNNLEKYMEKIPNPWDFIFWLEKKYPTGTGTIKVTQKIVDEYLITVED